MTTRLMLFTVIGLLALPMDGLARQQQQTRGRFWQRTKNRVGWMVHSLRADRDERLSFKTFTRRKQLPAAQRQQAVAARHKKALGKKIDRARDVVSSLHAHAATARSYATTGDRALRYSRPTILEDLGLAARHLGAAARYASKRGMARPPEIKSLARSVLDGLDVLRQAEHAAWTRGRIFEIAPNRSQIMSELRNFRAVRKLAAVNP